MFVGNAFQAAGPEQGPEQEKRRSLNFERERGNCINIREIKIL
jgi:hypothetical protein